MISPGQDVPALRGSATARELERVRARRRLLEQTAAKYSPTPGVAALIELQQPQAIPKPGDDPAIRNARIKSNARKLLDQLQAADTSLGDTSHNLKLMFAKQALRALADRQAAVAAEAQHRKLDQLRERLEEEHRRQHQQKHQQALQAQLQAQQHSLAQAQQVAAAQASPARASAASAPAPAPAITPGQSSSVRLERGHSSPRRRHRSRPRSEHRRRSPSRRSISPVEVLRSGDEYKSMVHYSYDSDAHGSDAVHVRDTRRSSSRSRDDAARPREASSYQRREPRHAGPTEAGMRGAVSAQALSALLAGLQSHGVNLTSGPPPPPAAAATAVQADPAMGVRGGGSGDGARGGGVGTAAEQQYVLLPDGTVGLVHTRVKPAVLQPQGTAAGQLLGAPAPPHAVPLVLLQPGGASPASGGGPPAAATIASWPHAGAPYGYGAAALGALPSPYNLPYGPQPQYPYPPPLYGMPSPLPPQAGYSFSPPHSTGPGASAAPQPPQPPYGSPYASPDSYYYHHHRQQQQQQGVSPDPQQPPQPVSQPLQEQQGQPYSNYRPDINNQNPQPGPGRGGPGQLAPHPPSHIARDVDAMGYHTRHSISSLSSDPYGNLGGPALVGGPYGPEDGAGAGPRAGGAGGPPPHHQQQQQVSIPQSAGSSGTAGTEPGPGNGPGGSGVSSGGRYHHRHSHSGAESLRSLPSNSGGSVRGVGVGVGGAGFGSVSQYEATLASQSPRDSLQNLDSPASFRDMAGRTSGSVSLSPLRGGIGGGGGRGSIDSGPHFTSAGDGVIVGGSGSGAARRRPSPLHLSSNSGSGGGGLSSDPNAPRVGLSGSSGSSSRGSIELRVTAAGGGGGSMSSQLAPGSSAFGAFSAGGEPSGAGSAAGTGAGEEPSLLLRTLDLGSPSLQRSKVSDEQTETPTSRKPSLTSPWSSSGPSDAAGAGLSLSGGSATGIYSSTRDLLADVASRPPLYGTSLPYGTAGLYDRYTAGGFYGATGGLSGPPPLYGAPGTGIGAGSGGGGFGAGGGGGGGGDGGGGSGAGGGGGGFGGFGVRADSGSLGDRGPSGGSAAVVGYGGLGRRSPSTDSIRSAGRGIRGYGGLAAASPPPHPLGGPPGTSATAAAADLMGTSAALALTATILEGSAASAAASSIIAGSTVGMSAAAVQGLSQLGLSHLHPTAAAAASSPSAAAAATTGGSGASPASAPAASGLGRASSTGRGGGLGSDSGSAPGAGAAGGSGSGQQGGVSMSSAANAALMARLSHASGQENMFSPPRTRSRVQLMGNDELNGDLSSPRTTTTSITNPTGTSMPGSSGLPQQHQQPQQHQHQQPQLAATGSMRLTAAALNAQQQMFQQQQQQQQAPASPAQPSPSRALSRSPSGTAPTVAASATDIGGLQPTVPTLQLPPRATSRMLGGAVAAAAAPPPASGAASGPSSETASPTRLDYPGLGGDLRDTDADLSLSARSGRSALSEGPGGAAATLLSTSSTERVATGVPVVEHHREGGGIDAASYASGLLGPRAIDPLAIGGGGVTAPAAPQQPALPSLLDVLNQHQGAFAASPSGSALLSPLGFGGGSTPLERSADSFVRIGSMPFSGAASPMATGNPIDLLGSPTKYPQQQGGGLGGTRGSSGGASSGGGGGAAAAGGAVPASGGGSALSPTISGSLPVLQPQQPQASPVLSSPQSYAAQAGVTTAPGQQQQPQQQQRLQPQPQPQPQLQQQQLSGMSFRVSNTGGTGVGAQALGMGGFASPSATAAAVAAAASAAGGGGLPRASSTQGMGGASSSLTAASPSAKVHSPAAGSKSGRFSLPAPLPSSPSQRGTSGSFAAAVGGGGRTGATAILSKVLSGRGEFDSDDEDDVGGGGGGGGLSHTASLGRGPGGAVGSGGFGGLRPVGGSGLIAGAGSSTGQRISGGPLTAGRGTLTGVASAHDDEFNF